MSDPLRDQLAPPVDRKSVGGAVLLRARQPTRTARRERRVRARDAEDRICGFSFLDPDPEVVLERHPDRFVDRQRRSVDHRGVLGRGCGGRLSDAGRRRRAGVCPKADSGMPETNRNGRRARGAHGRAIEARNCWYKRIAQCSPRTMDRKTESEANVAKTGQHPVLYRTDGPERTCSNCILRPDFRPSSE